MEIGKVVILKLKQYHYGAPQGYIFGPLLFILYVNGLSNVSNKFVLILVADDTTILFEGYNIHSIVTSLNYELGKLIILLNAIQLSRNVSKTHYMVFHRANENYSYKKIYMPDLALLVGIRDEELSKALIRGLPAELRLNMVSFNPTT